MVLSACSLSTIDKKSDIYKNQGFIVHNASGKYGSYLQMNIYYPPVKKLFEDIDADLGQSLNKKNARTEAHITVITPVEYRDILEPAGLTISKINQIALNMNIQQSDFEVVCLGKAEKYEKTTSFLVVDSEDLFNLRRAIFREYTKLGGKPSQWDPELFYPHITVGYSHRDLHLDSDGIYKGYNSCWRKVEI